MPGETPVCPQAASLCYVSIGSEMTSAQEKKISQTGCDTRFDNLTRQLYSTDASIYQIEPFGVAFPRNAQQASAVIRTAADASVPITPRGAGTILDGNAIAGAFRL